MTDETGETARGVAGPRPRADDVRMVGGGIRSSGHTLPEVFGGVKWLGRSSPAHRSPLAPTAE